MSETVNVTRTTIDFLRHGEVAGGPCLRGVTDDPLTEKGWQQMHSQCAGGQWSRCISSPLRRCAEFAAALSQERHFELELDPNWREISFGDWDGLPASQIDPKALERYYANPDAYTPPNAEAYAAFADRIGVAWERLLRHHAGQSLLVITHAGVIRHLFAHLLAISVPRSLHIEVPHACLTRFSCFDDAAGRFVQLNYHRPLGF